MIAWIAIISSPALAQVQLPPKFAELNSLQRTEYVVDIACKETIINDLVRNGVRASGGFVEDGIEFRKYENGNALVYYVGPWELQAPPAFADLLARQVLIKNLQRYPAIAFLAGVPQSMIRKLFVDGKLSELMKHTPASDVLAGEAAVVTFNYRDDVLWTLEVDCRGTL